MKNWNLAAAFLSLIWVCLQACDRVPEHPVSEKPPFAYEDFLEKTPSETYEAASVMPPVHQDSLYRPLLLKLQQTDRNTLTIEHASWYEKLRGRDPGVQMFLCSVRGDALLLLGNYDSSIVLNQRVLTLAGKHPDNALVVQAYYSLGMAHRLKGDYAACTRYYLQGMQKAAATGDSVQFNALQVEQAAVLYLTKDFDASVECAKRALPWFEKARDTSMLAYLYTVQGLAYGAKNAFDTALICLNLSLALNRSAKEIRGEAESLNNLSVVLRKQKKWDEAIVHLEAALPLMEKAEDFRNVSILRSNLGDCYNKVGRYADAIRCLEPSRKEQLERGQLHNAAYNTGYLASAYAGLGDYSKAYDHLKNQRTLLDSIFQNEKTDAIRELNIRFETEQKEHQIARLEAQEDVQHLWLGLALTGVLLFSVATGFLFYRLRQKQKLFEKEQQLKSAREIAHQQALESTQKELDFHRNALEETAVRLVEKNRIVETLHTNLDALQSELDVQASGSPQPLHALYQMKILTDADWTEFRVKFERVYPGFMADLRRRFPDLTDAELRLAMMIRMDVRPREIASMLGVSPESVGKTRYRLRKRLGLVEDDSLEAVLLGAVAQN